MLSDEKEPDVMVETAVNKQLVFSYQGKTAQIGYYRKAKDKSIYAYNKTEALQFFRSADKKKRKSNCRYTRILWKRKYISLLDSEEKEYVHDFFGGLYADFFPCTAKCFEETVSVAQQDGLRMVTGDGRENRYGNSSKLFSNFNLEVKKDSALPNSMQESHRLIIRTFTIGMRTGCFI